MRGITAAIPYGFSALAQIRWRLADRRAMVTTRFVRDAVVAVISLAFSIAFIWYSRNTGAENPFTYWAPFILAGVALVIGIPVYMAQRRRMTPPEAVPPTGEAVGVRCQNCSRGRVCASGLTSWKYANHPG